jgi:hypothetical protein
MNPKGQSLSRDCPFLLLSDLYRGTIIWLYYGGFMKRLLPALLLSASVSAFAQVGDAHLFIYRPHNKLVAVAVHPTVTCNDQPIAKLPNGSTLEVDIPVGTCRIHVASSSLQADYDLKLDAGKNYYLRMIFILHPGFIHAGEAGIQLREIPESEAKAEMAKLNVIPADKILVSNETEAAHDREVFAKALEENGLRQGTDLSVVTNSSAG